mmetsp:Transcript_64422/g.122120  ORF Transcript_64422/g.122120 Transcript_64422/m.122120 type:complete len:218 (+) Transcript_64422:295-948(+)
MPRSHMNHLVISACTLRRSCLQRMSRGSQWCTSRRQQQPHLQRQVQGPLEQACACPDLIPSGHGSCNIRKRVGHNLIPAHRHWKAEAPNAHVRSALHGRRGSWRMSGLSMFSRWASRECMKSLLQRQELTSESCQSAMTVGQSCWEIVCSRDFSVARLSSRHAPKMMLPLRSLTFGIFGRSSSLPFGQRRWTLQRNLPPTTLATASLKQLTSTCLRS